MSHDLTGEDKPEPTTVTLREQGGQWIMTVYAPGQPGREHPLHPSITTREGAVDYVIGRDPDAVIEAAD